MDDLYDMNIISVSVSFLEKDFKYIQAWLEPNS